MRDSKIYCKFKMLKNQIALIEKYNPTLKIDDVINQISGWRQIITINNSLVFKFPKTADVFEKFNKEKYVADNVRKKIFLKIPEYRVEKDFSFFILPQEVLIIFNIKK